MRDLLDECLLAVRRIEDPFTDVHGLAEAISSALHQVYRALAAATDSGLYTDAMVIAAMEVEAALIFVGDQNGDSAASLIQERLLEALGLSSHAAPPGERLRFPNQSRAGVPTPASRGTPQVLDISREIAMPVVAVRPRRARPAPPDDAPAQPSPIRSLDDLDALLAAVAEPAPDSSAPAAAMPSPRPSEIRQTSSDILLEYARTAIEEMGCFGLQRAPLSGQTWTGKARLEARILARVDAIVACGADVLPALVQRLEQRPLPDPEARWALILTYGCLAGDDTVDEAARLARSAELDDPDVRHAVMDALAHVPTPAIERRLRAWLASPIVAERAVAVAALGRRGALTSDELAAAASDADADVVRSAAAALGTTKGKLDDWLVDRLLHHEEEAVVGLALRGGVLRQEAAALRRARSLVTQHQGAFGDAGVVFALTQGRAGLDALLEDAAVAGESRSLEALGWFGHISAVPYLIGRTGSDEEAPRSAAARALQRILGSHRAAGIAQLASRPPSDGPSEDPDVWRELWAHLRPSLDPEVRYRFGAPWSPAANTGELRADFARPEDRVRAHLELSGRLGLTAGLDTRVFVAAQRCMLDAIEGEVRESGLGGGGWPVSLHV
ncbi:MAG: hypothetical protein EVA89_00495 [Sandaracinaceae bacterium]|nr:MAG: hypothetical protein EVA89_00495 [Sandaracinaceae bacterium]